jgi:hypothetical protein
VDLPGRLPLQMQEPYHGMSLHFLNRHHHFASALSDGSLCPLGAGKFYSSASSGNGLTPI